jgi:hypothetical protein
MEYEGPQIDTIPENIAVMHGDVGKTKLPLFGRPTTSYPILR